MTAPRIVSAIVGLLLLAAPAAAYIVVLKDGSRIEAREAYVIEGDKAIITLQSGTETFIDASEIDVPRTEEANQANLGSVLVLEDGEFVSKSVRQGGETTRRERVSDLIERGDISMRSGSRTDLGDASDSAPAVSASTTLEQFDRRPLRNIELSTAIKTAFQDRGLERVAVYQGTDAERAFIELTADSEASVFRGLEVAAEVLLAVRELFPDECSLFELLMATANRQRAGEFELTPEIAESLQGSADAASVFVRHVRF